jgi:1-acyl-sn-glycerol-3-phosphate acyltransferase
MSLLAKTATPGACRTKRPPWAVHLRMLRLFMHLMAGLAIVTLWFPLISPAHRRQLKICFSRRLLGIMGVALRVHGTVADGALQISNHISWIDIFVISAVQPSAFIAKAEIRRWPLIGWLSKETDTLFIERGSRRHAQHIAHQMASLLAATQSVTVFPEGTTSDGRDVLPFHAALLQPAISAQRPVQPLAIRYRDAAGQTSTAPAYIDQLSFADSIRNTLALRGLTVDLIVLPPLPCGADSTRRELATAAESAIRTAIRTALHSAP